MSKSNTALWGVLTDEQKSQFRFDGGVEGKEQVMTQRAYTLDEIDRMRVSVRSILSGGMQRCSGSFGVYPSVQRMWDAEDARAEDQLRTYMAGGVSPEELETKAGGK